MARTAAPLGWPAGAPSVPGTHESDPLPQDELGGSAPYRLSRAPLGSDASAFHQVIHLQLRGFLSAQAVVQQNGQNCPMAQVFQRRVIRRIKQRLDLAIAQGRYLAFVGFDPRLFDAMHRIATGYRVAVQEMIEQAGQRCELAANGSPCQAATFQICLPCQDMRPGDLAKVIGAGQSYKEKEIRQVILIGTTRAWVVDVGKLFDCSWYCSQLLKLDRC